MYLLLVIFSWPSLLAVERGNNDVLAFVVLFAGISLSQSYLRAFSIVLATVLKIYPAFVAFTFAKRRKIIIPLLVLIAGYFLYNLDELKILQAGNTALSDPASLIASYGFDTNLRVLHYITLRSTTSVLLKAMLILVSGVLSALISRTKYLNLTNPSTYNTDLFLAGGLVFSCTYLLTSNWDYRLIFLLLCIPFILSIQSRVVRHSMLIGILLSSNVPLLWEYFGQFGMMLWTLSHYYLFVMVTAYLVREFTNYLSVIPWLQAHHLSKIAHRVPEESK